ncbi:hypothetical protein ElyMa_003487600 [Elysia marginata]|uniref:Uncharacterized protein n=1 Tax=Elysia marginata TaxID=1093978 RepID=A0AAV4EDC7_9GAST|nr:hypothetical protein ElyMa_003487600 [Elysia marginata]
MRKSQPGCSVLVISTRSVIVPCVRKGLDDILEETEEESGRGSIQLDHSLSLDADIGEDGPMLVFGEGVGILADLVGMGASGKDGDLFPLGLDLSLGFSERMNVGITSDKSCSTVDSDYGECCRLHNSRPQ